MGLNQNSSQRREKGKLLPSFCQTLVWAGQDRGWTSISDLHKSTLALRLRLLFRSPIVVFCCRVELPDGDPEHRHILKAKTWTWFWQGHGIKQHSFFCVFTLWLSQLLPPQLVPEGSRTASLLHGELDFVHGTQWIPPLSTVAKHWNQKAFL